MYLLIGFTAGIVGTLTMTLFIRLYSIVFQKPFFVIEILGFLLSRKVRNNNRLAAIIHYAIGVFFSCIFISLISWDKLEFNLSSAMTFGAMAGSVGVLGWTIFLSLNPLRLRINKIHYLIIIWLGHIVFSIGMYVTFTALYRTNVTDSAPI